VVRVDRAGSQADRQGDAICEDAFLGGVQIRVVREHEGRVGGNIGETDIPAALSQIHERGAESIESLRERGTGCDHPGRRLPLDPRGVLKRATKEGRVAPDVRLEGPKAIPEEPHEPGGIRRTQEKEPGLDIGAHSVGEEEGSVRGVQEDVHAPRTAREIVKGESR